ncbi:MAG TPA: allophanate hydrolase [Steroidobacteraceae bacterium]|nr:allophanate hydrolase [Steroidobacteraceae bacterium]
MMRSLAIHDLRAAYLAGATPRTVIEEVLERVIAAPEHNTWISRLSLEQVMAYVDALERKDMKSLPLYGIPFAIKDNIDLAYIPTTAACAEFAYKPVRSATVVQKLIDAGAIPIGKTNLDQFATGLVGTRSPFGAGRNSFNPDYISGGSSAGSATAVALGLVSFSLGTDTAGSGRVPAAFNNLIGLKPSCGLLSTAGVVPACRTLDCVSIFALTATDAAQVLRVAEGFDAEDDYSRRIERRGFNADAFRFGVPKTIQLEFFGDRDAAALFEKMAQHIESQGGARIEIDLEPFLNTARLLYEGPWVAERYTAIADFVRKQPQALHPVTRQIIEPAATRTAEEAFTSQYRLQSLRRQCALVWQSIDVMLTPTAGTIYTIDEVTADPIRLNSNLGYYTNFVNLLDLAAVAVPAGFRSDGMPFGVTLTGQSGSDEALLRLAHRVHRSDEFKVGHDIRAMKVVESPQIVAGFLSVVVCGAHMRGLPLNHQLTARGGYFVRQTQSAPRYRLYALPGGPPVRPGMISVNEGGAAIDVEEWAIPVEQLGSFLAGIPAPLGLGRVQLQDGSQPIGFTCEASAAAQATDVTHFGGWRAYLASLC